MMTSTIAVVLVFGILVLVHELGHFITAKLTGMRVDEFAIGFGKKLWSRQYGETVYSLRMIPLGGFNKIAGMEQDADLDAGKRAFWARPIWARMIVILAGSAMNFITPILIFAGIFFYNGITTPVNQPYIGEIVVNGPAYTAGLRSGDKIISINNQPINTWTSFVEHIKTADGQVLKVIYERNGQEFHASLIPQYNQEAHKAVVGVMAPVEHTPVSFIDSFKYAIMTSARIVAQMYYGLYQMITGQVSADLAGPVGVAQMTGQAAQMGLVPLLQFAAFLSLNLAIINLLPVPALDGGHFLLLLLEAIRRKPINPRYARTVQMFGMVVLLSLMVYATANDITRLFR